MTTLNDFSSSIMTSPSPLAIEFVKLSKKSRKRHSRILRRAWPHLLLNVPSPKKLKLSQMRGTRRTWMPSPPSRLRTTILTSGMILTAMIMKMESITRCHRRSCNSFKSVWRRLARRKSVVASNNLTCTSRTSRRALDRLSHATQPADQTKRWSCRSRSTADETVMMMKRSSATTN